MITKNNFRKVLEKTGFTHKDNFCHKKINNEIVEADFANEKLVYPKGVTIEGDFTTNFTSNESTRNN